MKADRTHRNPPLADPFCKITTAHGKDMISATHAPSSFRPPAPYPLAAPLGPIRFLLALRANPIGTWTQAHFEDFFVHGRSLLGDLSVVSDPAAIRRIFVENTANYRKDALQLRLLRPGLGKGLLTADGEDWRVQRRTLAPLFTPRRVGEFLPAMRDSARRLIARWEGLRERRRIDLASEMSLATLDVLERTLFPGGLAGDPVDVARALTTYFETVGRIDPFDVLNLPKWIPRFGKQRGVAAVEIFGQLVGRMIEQGRRQLREPGSSGSTERPDLLALLLQASDPETGQGLSEADVHANVATFIGAGHETTANALTWSLYLLAHHPDWRARTEAEVDDAFALDSVTDEGLRGLIVTRAVLEEALRLYPPAASLSREAIGPDELCGHRIKAGTTVVISPWLVHRHRLLWRDPDLFDPGRFMPGARESIHRFAYLPFGAGPRACIGQSFAMQEALVFLAAILQRFRLNSAPGRGPTPVQRITLRPLGGMPMLISRR